MTYYIEKDNKIVLHDTDKSRLVRTLKFTPQFAELEIKETERHIENGEWADTEDYIAKKHKQEVTQQVNALEEESGLKRAIRELVLADKSSVSEYVKAKAQEIEALAEELRS